MPSSDFKGSVNERGDWLVEGTQGVIVVPAGIRWAVKLTIDHNGKWVPSPLPAENDPNTQPKPEFVHLYDSTNPQSLIPFASDTHNVLIAYKDGLFNDLNQARKMFPHDIILTVVVRFGDTGNFGDCEAGDLSEGEAIAMWESKLTDGIYADLSTWTAMLTVVQNLEKKRDRKCIKWVADPNPNNVPHIPAWADICQYGFDGTFDVSLARYASIAHLL